MDEEILERFVQVADKIEQALSQKPEPPPKPKIWKAVLASVIVSLVICAGCNLAVYRIQRAELNATRARLMEAIAELRRITSMQMEDPKYFDRIEKQHDAIRAYEKSRGRL